MKIKSVAPQGFTLVEIMIVIAIIGLLASIAVPSYVKARDNSQQNACINNLRQIYVASLSWALENKKTAGDPYTLSVIKPYIKMDNAGNIPACPAGGTYAAGTAVSHGPTCTIPNHVLP